MYICTDFMSNGKKGIVLYDSMTNSAKTYSYEIVKDMLEREIPIMGLFVSKGVISSTGRMIDGKITIKTRLVEPRKGFARKEFIVVHCNSNSYDPCYKFFINDKFVGELPDTCEYGKEDEIEYSFVDVDSYCGKVLALFKYELCINEDRDNVVRLVLFYDGKEIADNEIPLDEYLKDMKKINTIDKDISSNIVMWNGKEIYLD